MANAWPPQVVERVGSWRYRWAGGVTRRANSVLAVGDAGPIDGLIDRAERFYRERHARPRFQVSCASAPGALAGTLRDRGYRESGRTLVQLADPGDVARRAPSAAHLAHRVDAHPTGAWFDTYWSVESIRGRGLDDAAVCRDVLLRPDLPAAFVAVLDRSEVVGVGQVVVEDGWAGVQCMATPPPHRRRGVASTVLHALALQAPALGADRMYLAVMADNVGARKVYDRAGFTTAYDYSYFAAPRLLARHPTGR